MTRFDRAVLAVTPKPALEMLKSGPEPHRALLAASHMRNHCFVAPKNRF